MEKREIESTDMGSYVIRSEEWRMSDDEEWTPIKAAYNKAGDYIGSADDAIHLCDSKGILPELSGPDHSTCSIGFCEREQKWYGWSHRAIYGFGVGSEVDSTDHVCATSGWVDGVQPDGTPDPLPMPVGFVASSLEDAKRMAVAFAAGVS